MDVWVLLLTANGGFECCSCFVICGLWVCALGVDMDNAWMNLVIDWTSFNIFSKAYKCCKLKYECKEEYKYRELY